MIVYIVIGAVIALLLVVAYRSLGGAATGPADDQALLRAGAFAIDRAAVHLQAAVGSGTPVADAGPQRGLRRETDAAQQQLERVDVASLSEDDADSLALLRVAAVELAWAARLHDAPQFASAPGMQHAVDELQVHARACIDDALVRLRLEPYAPEPRAGAATP